MSDFSSCFLQEPSILNIELLVFGLIKYAFSEFKKGTIYLIWMQPCEWRDTHSEGQLRRFEHVVALRGHVQSGAHQTGVAVA